MKFLDTVALSGEGENAAEEKGRLSFRFGRVWADQVDDGQAIDFVTYARGL